MRYTAIILDDEEKGRKGLEKLLTDYCPEVDLKGIAGSGEEAYSMICKVRPQILFLDIEIAQASTEYTTSFELISRLPKYDYEVIFVTAFEHYALQALRSHAIGYVLKPVAIEDLINAVNDGIENLSKSSSSRTSEMVAQLNSGDTSNPRIWIHSNQDIIPINTSEIIRLEAQGKYTDIHIEKKGRITSSKNLGEFYNMLNNDQFVKVHRSHIINVDRIERFSKSDGGYVVTSDGKIVTVSKNGRERLLEGLGKHNRH